MADIVIFPGQTTRDFEPDRVIDGLREAKLEGDLLVVGEAQGGELYLAASTSRLPDLLLLLKRAERQIMAYIP